MTAALAGRFALALLCLTASTAALAQEEEEGEGEEEAVLKDEAEREKEKAPPKRKPKRAQSAEPKEGAIPHWAETWPETFKAARKEGTLRMKARLSPAALLPGPGEVFAVVEIRAPLFPVERQAGLNLALVLDHSDSMRGARLVAMKRAARDVIGDLDAEDHLAIVAISEEADVLPSAPVTEENRARMLAYVDKLTGAGGSNLAAGLEAAINQLTPRSPDFEFNRIIAVTDGMATRGLTDRESLAAVARKARTVYRIHVSAVGVGEDADEDVLQRIVKDGWGFVAYVRGPSQVPRVGHRQKLEVLRRAAEQIELRLRISREVELLGVLGYHSIEAGPSMVSVPLAEAGPGDVFQVVLHLKVNVPAKASSPYFLGVAELNYLDLLGNQGRSSKLEISADLAGPRKPAPPDPQVSLIAAKAITARNLVLAEERFEEDNAQRALEILDQTEEVLGQLMRVTPQDSLSEELVAVAQAMERYAPHAKPAAPAPKKKGKGGRRR
jgi:Ca-activated chloride channel family protein